MALKVMCVVLRNEHAMMLAIERGDPRLYGSGFRRRLWDKLACGSRTSGLKPGGVHLMLAAIVRENAVQ